MEGEEEIVLYIVFQYAKSVSTNQHMAETIKHPTSFKGSSTSFAGCDTKASWNWNWNWTSTQSLLRGLNYCLTLPCVVACGTVAFVWRWQYATVLLNRVFT